MSTFVRLYAYSGKGYDVFVESYDPKTKKLKVTRDRAKAKVWNTKAGAESSARSIFGNYLAKIEGFDYVFNVGEYVK